MPPKYRRTWRVHTGQLQFRIHRPSPGYHGGISLTSSICFTRRPMEIMRTSGRPLSMSAGAAAVLYPACSHGATARTRGVALFLKHPSGMERPCLPDRKYHLLAKKYFQSRFGAADFCVNGGARAAQLSAASS